MAVLFGANQGLYFPSFQIDSLFWISFMVCQDLPFEGSNLMMHVGNSDFIFFFFADIVSVLLNFLFFFEDGFLMMHMGTSGFGFRYL